MSGSVKRRLTPRHKRDAVKSINIKPEYSRTNTCWTDDATSTLDSCNTPRIFSQSAANTMPLKVNDGIMTLYCADIDCDDAESDNNDADKRTRGKSNVNRVSAPAVNIPVIYDAMYSP
jgi:hypothetical protein